VEGFTTQIPAHSSQHNNFKPEDLKTSTKTEALVYNFEAASNFKKQ
jgi:hypothetical protein